MNFRIYTDTKTNKEILIIYQYISIY